MSEIAAVARTLSASTANARSILALKLQHQQEQAVVELVTKVLNSTPQPSAAGASSGGRLVDIVV